MGLPTHREGLQERSGVEEETVTLGGQVGEKRNLGNRNCRI